MKKFPLSHVCLYAKGWYNRSENVWNDIRKCLSADGYCGDLFTNSDCLNVILNRWSEMQADHTHSFNALVFGAMDHNCWKHGYSTKTNWSYGQNIDQLPDYDYMTAVLWYILSSLQGCESSAWIQKRPDFKGCLKKAGWIDMGTVRRMFKDVEK